MDFELTKEELDFRQEAEDFIKAETPSYWLDDVVYWPGGYGTFPEMESEFRDDCRVFLKKIGKKGWLSLSWPEKYGGKNSMIKQAIVNETLSYYRMPHGGVATSISGPTIAQVGSEEMKQEWLPKIASGEAGFWLAYSEPNAGSDLGSLKTTAIEDGDDFILNGQKIWSSGAHVVEYAWMLARTDPSASKHRGASLMIIDNNTPGITMRPIVNICGIHSFNEVFFDDVRVPKKNVVGQLNRGFYNVMLALQFERMMIGLGAFQRTLEDLVDCAKKTKQNGEYLSDNRIIRNKLASMAIEIEALRGFYWRVAWMIDNGQVPELEASVLKLFATELGQKLADVGMDVLGPYGQLDKGSKYAMLNGRIGLGYLDSVSGPIGAGTSEVQRSIIATRGMGLPRA